MGARVCIPILGRFLQVDPAEGGCLNNHVYAMDPVNQRDLSGKGLFDWAKKAFDIAKEVVISAKYYVHWLFGRGASVTYSNPQMEFRVVNFDDKITKNTKPGCVVNKSVSLQTKGIHRSETIGGARGSARGELTIEGKTWRFRGTVSQVKDKYDLDIRWREGLTLRNIANGVANIGGFYCETGIPMLCKPTDYEVTVLGEFYAEGSGEIDE